VIRTVGDDYEPRRFSTWAPIVLCGIGRLSATIEDRSIEIRMRRRRQDDAVEPLRLNRTADSIEVLARQPERWRRDHAAALDSADPEMPSGLFNRAADNRYPLLTVAKVAGGQWPERAQSAARSLTLDVGESESHQLLALGDLRDLFDAEAKKKANALFGAAPEHVVVQPGHR
jgi:hypothetical protein